MMLTVAGRSPCGFALSAVTRRVVDIVLNRRLLMYHVSHSYIIDVSETSPLYCDVLYCELKTPTDVRDIKALF
jgi:hypothetical protein